MLIVPIVVVSFWFHRSSGDQKSHFVLERCIDDAIVADDYVKIFLFRNGIEDSTAVVTWRIEHQPFVRL